MFITYYHLHQSTVIFPACHIFDWIPEFLKHLKKTLIFYASQQHIIRIHTPSHIIDCWMWRFVFFSFQTIPASEWTWGGENNPFYFKPPLWWSLHRLHTAEGDVVKAGKLLVLDTLWIQFFNMMIFNRLIWNVEWGIKLSFQFVSWLVFNFTDGAQIANQFGGIMFAWTAVFYIQPVTQATYGHLRRLVFCVLYSALLTVEYGGKIQNPFNNRLVWAAICKQFVTTLALMQRTAT